MNRLVSAEFRGGHGVRPLGFLSLVAAAFSFSFAWAAELDLSGSWTAEEVSPGERRIRKPFAYEVPGGIQSALLKAGLIPDSFYGTNEVLNVWIGRADWRVTRSFDVSSDLLAKKEVVLRLEDCDTFASVSVNGRNVGETSDRFQRYTFDVKSALKPGKNVISAVFRSPEKEADARRARVGRPYPISNVVWSKNQALIRKPACHAGWDWGPSVQVAGFCGTVKLVATDGPRLDYVYTTQKFNDDFSHCTLTVTGEFSDGTKESKTLEIDNPPLWWPNGAGERKFYTYAVDLGGEKVTRRIGLRRIEVLNEKTVSRTGKEELSLVFRVNGRRLFMKGANWIPASAYENEQTPARYRQLLESATACNMNMIRVWGGGQYEKDVFYDLCDELGLLVWHDMMHSCAVYPAEDWFLDEVKAELAHQLRRLRDHASIALWCGDNECLGAIGWYDETRKDPAFYRDCWVKRSRLQGELAAKYDPTRTYWPSSPCCGPDDFGDAWKEDSKGDMHNWDVWHENAPFAKYYDYHPRFCSEFGFQSFPSMEVAETFATRGQILSRAPEFEWHQKNPGGNARIRKTMERYFPEPKDVPSELLLSQFQQAMAIQTAVDAWRSEQPRCMGTLFWQLNDNWPVASWSSIEYGGKWKPLQYLARRFYAPVHVTLAPDGAVSVINGTDRPLTGHVVVMLHGFDGRQREQVPMGGLRTVPANAALKVGTVEASREAVMELRFMSDDRTLAVNFPVRASYRDVKLPRAEVARKVEGFRVTLTTDRPAFWTWLDTPGIAGTFDDNAVTLVPGSPRTFTFAPADPATTPEAFARALTVVHLAELCGKDAARAELARLRRYPEAYVAATDTPARRARLIERLWAHPGRPDVRIWPEGKVPLKKSDAPLRNLEHELWQSNLVVTDVNEPQFTFFAAPGDGTKPAVVILPGGGYRQLGWNKEGTEIAEWLNSIGFSAAVLLYRAPGQRAAALCDVQRTIRLLRRDAKKYGVRPDRIGVIGFSAGANLAVRAATNWRTAAYARIDGADDLSCRPDFQLPIYPWDLLADWDKSRHPELRLKPEYPVDAETPPAFIAQAQDDFCRIETTYGYALALDRAGVKTEVHVYPSGGHGYGLRRLGSPCDAWSDSAAEWLKRFR